MLNVVRQSGSRNPDTGSLLGVSAVISGGRLGRGHSIYTPIRWIVLLTSPRLFSVVMLHRRNLTNVASDHVSPRPTSSSLGGRRPLSIAVNQQTFHASTAVTLETESPRSETFPQPQATPSIPPRPPAFPHPPPGIGGLRRKSTRHTYETDPPALEEHVPTSSQAPNITPMPSPPFSQVSRHPPPTPTRAPGGGVGGFAGITPFHYDPSRNDSYHSTAKYTYRFHTMPSPRSDSGPPRYESAAVTGGIHAKVWPTYNRISKEFDHKKLEKWNSDLDALLIFVSLVFGCDR